jgi:DHA1 family multidrug resistance protein-like MFS transporter
MKDIIRDSTVGQFINYISGGRYLPYDDQRADYIIPAHFLPPSSKSTTEIDLVGDKKFLSTAETSRTASPTVGSPRAGVSLTRNNTLVENSIPDHEKGEVKGDTLVFDPYLVGWNGDHDPENPRYGYLSSLLNILF